MVRESTPDTFWDETDDRPLRPAETLMVDVDGFAGPLDLLLSLARDQKVDLAGMSMLALAEQYLAFITEARRLKLELAADYLVMAAWLAYLKSRLLIPEPPADDEPSGEDLAEHLAFRLKRLEAMREVGAKLMARPQLGRDIFQRGMPEGVRSVTTPDYQDTLYDLLSAYARERIRTSVTAITISKRPVMSLDDARALLVRLIGSIDGWASLDRLLIVYAVAPDQRRTALASSFTASLELVRDGTLEVRQDGAYAPLMVRRVANA